MNIDKKKEGVMKKQEKRYKQIILKRDEEFKKFEKLCDKLNLKKATIISALIKKFNENPQKFLFEDI